MPNCTPAELTFPSFDRRKIEANFDGGDVSSDGGILLLREADRATIDSTPAGTRVRLEWGHVNATQNAVT